LAKEQSIILFASGLRIEKLSQRNSAELNQTEIDGIQQRVQDGRFGEPLPQAKLSTAI